jgi:hypothetical protein
MKALEGIEWESKVREYAFLNLALRTSSRLLARWFLARLIFDPEDGGDTFFRNVGSHTDCMALYPRRKL